LGGGNLTARRKKKNTKRSSKGEGSLKQQKKRVYGGGPEPEKNLRKTGTKRVDGKTRFNKREKERTERKREAGRANPERGYWGERVARGKA